MDEEEIINKTTKLLEQGCTMLATHHDCGAPLFRCKGEVVCPVCSFVPGKAEDKFALGHQEAQKEAIETKSSPNSKAVDRPASDDDLILAEQAVRRTVLDKLMVLNESLKGEQDLAKLHSILDCIEAALCVMRSLNALKRE